MSIPTDHICPVCHKAMREYPGYFGDVVRRCKACGYTESAGSVAKRPDYSLREAVGIAPARVR